MLHWLAETLRCYADLALFPSLTIGFLIGLTKTVGLILGKVAAIFSIATVTQLGLADEQAKTLIAQICLGYDFTDRFETIGPAFVLTQRGSQLIGADLQRPPRVMTKSRVPAATTAGPGALSAYYNRMPYAVGMLGDDLRHGDRRFILVTA